MLVELDSQRHLPDIEQIFASYNRAQRLAGIFQNMVQREKRDAA